MLERFREGVKLETEELARRERAGTLPPLFLGPRPSFVKSLLESRENEPLGVIAEYKRASPSAGDICLSLSCGEVARQYWEAGARAISVLTEKKWFKGDLEFLREAAEACPAPLLRKDFIAHPLQVRAAASTPASAILLIVRLTPAVDTLKTLIAEAERYGLDAVVEIFNGDELGVARKAGAKIIQVNARDLNDFRVNRTAALRLIENSPPKAGETWIAASGVTSPEDLSEAAKAGYRAALVGTALMRDARPGASLKRLLRKTDDY